MENSFSRYAGSLSSVIIDRDWDDLHELAICIRKVWMAGKQMFICGNGGSAANAIHLANDLLYGVTSETLPGIKVEALSANSAVLTCLANDISYDEIYSQQLVTKGAEGDILLVLSGSGNSQNVVRALEVGNQLKMETFAILAYSGGRCKTIAKNPIFFPIDDMQIAEDLQLVCGHMCMQWLKKNGSSDQ